MNGEKRELYGGNMRTHLAHKHDWPTSGSAQSTKLVFSIHKLFSLKPLCPQNSIGIEFKRVLQRLCKNFWLLEQIEADRDL